ncbi:unnamed protein product [Urochloa humidicola]
MSPCPPFIGCSVGLRISSGMAVVEYEKVLATKATKWKAYNKDVPVVLIDMHRCSLGAKSRKTLGTNCH